MAMWISCLAPDCASGDPDWSAIAVYDQSGRINGGGTCHRTSAHACTIRALSPQSRWLRFDFYPEHLTAFQTIRQAAGQVLDDFSVSDKRVGMKEGF